MNPEISATMLRYEAFINDVLKEDLRKIDKRMDHIVQEISEYTQQKHILKIVCEKTTFPEGFKTHVDVGCNFYIQAKVEDASSMLFNVGLNHYLEFTKAEAEKYIDARVAFLEESLKELKEKSAETKAHIKLMLFGIGQLQDINPKQNS